MSEYKHSNGGPSMSSSSGCSSSNNASSSSSSLEYTQDQVEAVRRIRKCKDYYEILGVTRKCTEAELKKQYRKMALQFHPDKNKAPGASEAFKAISNAFVVLSDPEKKEKYDLHGSENPPLRQSRHYYSRSSSYTEDEYFGYTRGFGEDMSAEELFNMFFGASNVYVRRNNRAGRTGTASPQQETSAYGVLVHMLPILLLVVFSMMSSFFVSDPAYSLQRTAKYSIKRITPNLQVPYFVKEDFETEHKSSVRRVERFVEEEYLNQLRSACYRERTNRDALVWRAKAYGDQEMLEKAKQYKMPSCTEYMNIQHKAGYAFAA